MNLFTKNTKSLAVSRTSQQAGTALAGSLHLLPSQVWFGTSCAMQLEYFLMLSPGVVHLSTLAVVCVQLYILTLTLATKWGGILQYQLHLY